jgi:hypothetical protein
VAFNQTLFGEVVPPSEQEIIDRIIEQGFAEVPFKLGRTACDELFGDYLRFVELCQEENGDRFAQAVTFEINNGLGNGAYHLTYREPGKINPAEVDRVPGSDHKYTFHFGTQTIERARAAIGGALPAEMEQCLQTSEAFFEEVLKSARIGATALGLEGVMFSGPRENWVHHLRLLHYIGDTPDLGAAHFDRAVATLAVTESRSGLRGAPGQNGFLDTSITSDYLLGLHARFEAIDHFENVAKFFLGAGYNHLPPDLRRPDLPLLGHDILNDNPGEARQAAVCFLNPTNDFRGYTVPDSRFETGFAEILKYLEKRMLEPQVA